MSSDTITVELEKREVVGKGLARLRADGVVPVVVHNHGKASIHAMGNFQLLTKVHAQAGKHHPVELKVDGKPHLALIKDVDFDPRKHQIRHVVFQAIRQNEKTTAEIPVVLAGEDIPAEKKGLLVLTQLDTVQVEALPRDLPNELTVDATTLEDDGDRLHVSDIQPPAGVTILTDPEATVATVEIPRDQVAEADAALEEEKQAQAATEEEGAEGETTDEETKPVAEDKPTDT
ncbi:MAG TPA: 50S ribosomal protein L25 [Candidatus Limnocylindria bacterium]|nr:50S ribosomal protein L25 [Candidatus Limnocylindria bacterium]